MARSPARGRGSSANAAPESHISATARDVRMSVLLAMSHCRRGLGPDAQQPQCNGFTTSVAMCQRARAELGQGPSYRKANAVFRYPTRPMTTLKGKTLFITGASRGIGLAIGLRAA